MPQKTTPKSKASKSSKSTSKPKVKKNKSEAKTTKSVVNVKPQKTSRSKKSLAVISAPHSSSGDNSTKKETVSQAKKSTTNPTVVTLLAATAAFSAAALGLSIYNFIGGSSLNINFGPDGNSANFTEGSIADIAEKVAPSVVSIITKTKTTNGWYTYNTTATASGTGMIISSDGYVLTNKHVVDGATEIGVVLDDGTTYSDVKLIGVDPLNDAAIIKINGVSDLKPVKLGDSKTLNVGQQVIAIGNALGQYQNSVTEGIISGVGRNITASDGNNNYYETLSDMIQTDAQINSGNSGGPLLNAAGEVIGINTALSASGTTGNSISFAIPISSVKGIIKSVIENGELKRAYIGVGYIPVTPTVAKSYNLSVDHGAYLANSDAIIAGGPAEKAGLKAGDIITKVGGIEIGKAGSLSTLIGEHSIGEVVKLTIVRDGKEITTDITLSAYETPEKTTIIRQ
ncbi:trypsin-like peptidase domain-containing protein [Candidatus Saccharibacteria bacterium]|nr:trypsin-like peptidase domain-containing protein [Candidatus Saccharibacteria bacterium]